MTVGGVRVFKEGVEVNGGPHQRKRSGRRHAQRDGRVGTRGGDGRPHAQERGLGGTSPMTDTAASGTGTVRVCGPSHCLQTLYGDSHTDRPLRATCPSLGQCGSDESKLGRPSSEGRGAPGPSEAAMEAAVKQCPGLRPRPVGE